VEDTARLRPVTFKPAAGQELIAAFEKKMIRNKLFSLALRHFF
jgi:hypothetical protein